MDIFLSDCSKALDNVELGTVIHDLKLYTLVTIRGDATSTSGV